MTVSTIAPPTISRRPRARSRWPAAIWRRLWSSLSTRLLPAALFTLLAVSKTQRLAAEVATPSSLPDPLLLAATWTHQALTILFLATVSAIYLLRQPRRGPRASLSWTLVALAGAYSPTAIALLPTTSQEPTLLLAADTLIILGVTLSWVSLWSLRRCFGILPEARGLVTSGPYRYLRHPIYAGEYLSVLGMALPTLSPLSIGLFLLFCLLQYLRSRKEEEALSALFPEYQAYRRLTPTLIPRGSASVSTKAARKSPERGLARRSSI